MDEAPKTTSTWSASQSYLEDLTAYVNTAEKLFLMARRNKNLIGDLFHHIHIIYAKEEPYFDVEYDKKGVLIPNCELMVMKTMHDEAQAKVESYMRGGESFKRDNFESRYKILDLLFRELNKKGVQKKFFPATHTARNLDDLKNSLKLR